MTVVNPKSISGINSITMASGSDNLLTIHTTNTTERVRVNSDGDVIVGSGITVSPDGDIFATGVTTSTTFVGALTGNVTGNISGGTVAGSTGTFTGDVDIADKIVHTGDTNTAIRFPAADVIAFETGSTERLRINSDGRIWVNTQTGSSATELLRVENTGSSSTDSRVSIISGGAAQAVLLFGDDQSYNQGQIVYANNDHSMRFHANGGTERLRIDSSGRLLLGTTTEGNASADDLTIATSGSTGITIRSGTSNAGNIYFSDGTSGSDEYAGYISYSHSTGSLSFGSNDGTEKVRIDSSGRLMIATTSTSGISASGDDIIIGSIGDSTARGLTFATTAAASIRWADAGDNAMGRIQYDNSTDVMTFHTSNTTRLRVDSDGLKFGSDSAAANALDDYEEGTWTPVHGSNGGSVASGGTYDNQHGTYTKIGDRVHISCYLGWPNGWSGASGNYAIDLPFTQSNSPSTYAAVNIGFLFHSGGALSSANEKIGGYVTGSKLILYRVPTGQQSSGSASGGQVGNATFSHSGGYIQFNITMNV